MSPVLGGGGSSNYLIIIKSCTYVSALPAQVRVEHGEVNCNGHRVFIPALRRAPRDRDVAESDSLRDCWTLVHRRLADHLSMFISVMRSHRQVRPLVCALR